eukprot:gene18363-20907_t
MGVAFGQMEGLEIGYDRVGSRLYEVRRYPPHFVAEVECRDDELQSACEDLDRYIGRFTEPENVKGSPIASIAGPQVSMLRERIPLRLPAIREKNSLQFPLPASYTSFEQVPVPTNPRVKIRAIPERYVAVKTFYGQCLRSQYTRQLTDLYKMLYDDGMILDAVETTHPFSSLRGVRKPLLASETKNNGGGATATAPSLSTKQRGDGTVEEEVKNEVHWSVAQYHPHRTYRCCRRNEVWIDLNMKNANVCDLVYNL